LIPVITSIEPIVIIVIVVKDSATAMSEAEQIQVARG
jgi:hypothetical protein